MQRFGTLLRHRYADLRRSHTDLYDDRRAVSVGVDAGKYFYFLPHIHAERGFAFFQPRVHDGSLPFRGKSFFRKSEKQNIRCQQQSQHDLLDTMGHHRLDRLRFRVVRIQWSGKLGTLSCRNSDFLRIDLSRRPLP